MAQQATDTFVTEIDGAPIYVNKGDVLPEGHPVLKNLPSDTHLFRKLQEEEPAKPRRGRPPKNGGSTDGGGENDG